MDRLAIRPVVEGRGAGLRADSGARLRHVHRAAHRSGKKRFLGRATAFDIILAIMLGSIAARAITGGTAFFAAMLALAVLVSMHWGFSAIARDCEFVSGLIKGHSTSLIKNGKVDQKALRAAHMSNDDLDEDLRDKGVDDPAKVAEARLERSGRLSVVKKE